MFYNLLFLVSGGTSIFIATGFVFGEKTIGKIIKLDTEAMKITLGSGFVCLLFHVSAISSSQPQGVGAW